MSVPLNRGFSTASRAAIKWGGSVTLEDIIAQNTGSGEKLKDAVIKMADNLEKQYPKIEEGKIQGARAHDSARDPTDKKKVITVGFYSANGTRLVSGHAHEDGTFKHWPSRAGRK